EDPRDLPDGHLRSAGHVARAVHGPAGSAAGCHPAGGGSRTEPLGGGATATRPADAGRSPAVRRGAEQTAALHTLLAPASVVTVGERVHARLIGNATEGASR